jgi:DNA polymerase III subunit delta
MPSQTIDTLLRSLKRGDIVPAYYFFGSEDLLKEEAIRSLLDQVLDPGLRDFNLDQRSAAQADPEEVYSLCRTPAMMAERRVVILRDVEAWKRKTKARNVALDYLAKPSPDTVLVLVQGSADEKEDKELARLAVTVHCDPLPPERAARWALRHARQLDIELEPAAADLLVRTVGVSLGALTAEVEKLAAAGDGTPVSEERVAALVGIRHGETMFDWRNAVFDSQAVRAAGMLDIVLDQAGVTGVKLLTLIGATLIGVGATRAAYDRNVRGSRLEDSAFQLMLRARPSALAGVSYKEESRLWARWSASWPLERVRAGLRQSVIADTALKNTTVSDERGVLLDLVYGLAMPMSEVA